MTTCWTSGGCLIGRPDSPSEVQGEGIGDCAGGDSVVRESGAMGREGGGLKAAKLSHYPCPRIRSFSVLSIGLMMMKGLIQFCQGMKGVALLRKLSRT